MLDMHLWRLLAKGKTRYTKYEFSVSVLLLSQHSADDCQETMSIFINGSRTKLRKNVWNKICWSCFSIPQHRGNIEKITKSFVMSSEIYKFQCCHNECSRGISQRHTTNHSRTTSGLICLVKHLTTIATHPPTIGEQIHRFVILSVGNIPFSVISQI